VTKRRNSRRKKDVAKEKHSCKLIDRELDQECNELCNDYSIEDKATKHNK
jgi:hypothetical protein